MTSLSIKNTAELVEMCIRGNRLAQEQFFKKYYPVLMGTLYRYINSYTDAEDLLQECFVKIFTSLKDLQKIEALEGWMRRIAVNSAITFLKKRKSLVAFNDQIMKDATAEEENEEIEEDFPPSVLHEQIAALPDGYRTVINLFAIEGYSHKQIAELLGISENTSRSQYMKAKAYLKTLLMNFKKKGMNYEA